MSRRRQIKVSKGTNERNLSVSPNPCISEHDIDDQPKQMKRLPGSNMPIKLMHSSYMSNKKPNSD
jgi:hypothetical protein